MTPRKDHPRYRLVTGPMPLVNIGDTFAQAGRRHLFVKPSRWSRLDVATRGILFAVGVFLVVCGLIVFLPWAFK